MHSYLQTNSISKQTFHVAMSNHLVSVCGALHNMVLEEESVAETSLKYRGSNSDFEFQKDTDHETTQTKKTRNMPTNLKLYNQWQANKWEKLREFQNKN